LKSLEAEVARADREAARRSSARHFALAYRYTWTSRPCLVAFAGLSGSGKSTVAAALHARIGFAHFNADVIRKRLAGLAPSARPQTLSYDAGLYTAAPSAPTHAQMLAEAAGELAERRGAIVDATFQRRADRDTLRVLARRFSVPLLIVECQSDEDVIRRRLAQRQRDGGDASDADWSIYLKQRRRYQAFDPDERTEHLVLDSSAPMPELTAAIEAALRERTPDP